MIKKTDMQALKPQSSRNLAAPTVFFRPTANILANYDLVSGISACSDAKLVNCADPAQTNFYSRGSARRQQDRRCSKTHSLWPRR